MIDKKNNFIFSALYSTSSGVNQSGDEPLSYWSWVGLRGAIPEGPRPHCRRAGCVGGRDYQGINCEDGTIKVQVAVKNI